MRFIRRRLKDEKILRLIWKFLRAGVMEGKLFRETNRGTPQGGIISPLLANIYLNELSMKLILGNLPLDFDLIAARWMPFGVSLGAAPKTPNSSGQLKEIFLLILMLSTIGN